jgi:hypothetical protein
VTFPDEDDLTELVDFRPDRVDLVQRPASGVPRFLIAKQDQSAGLLDPEFVRSLIAKEAPVPDAEPGETTLSNGIILKGSPAAMAAFIHAASRREPEGGDVAKAEQSTATQNDLPDSDFGYIEPGGKKDEHGRTVPRSLRHFPIQDACIIGDVEIPLLDGRQFPIRELIGVDEFWVYSYDSETRAIVPGRGHSARMTMEAQTIARVILDSGEVVETTPDHRFMLRSGGYRMAQDLAPGDSLMPLYHKTVMVHDKPYERLWQPFYRYWELTHHAMDRFAHGPLLNGNVVHHRNENQFDNRPENLEQMTRAAHLAHHADLNGAEHVERLLEGSRRRWERPGEREKASQRRRDFNLQMLAEGRLPTKPFRDWCATRESAVAVHERYMAGETLTALAAEFGVSQSGLKLGFKRHGLPSRKQAAELNNHKVVGVEFVDEPQPVYDLTVDTFHNFAIGAGVFVHNSHTRNALARAPQSPFGDKAMPKIRAAAERFGIDVAKEAEAADVGKSWAAYNAAHPHHGAKKLPAKPTASAFQRAQQTLALERAGGTPTKAELANAHAVHEAHLAHLAHEKALQEQAAEAAAKPEAQTAAAPAAAPARTVSPVNKQHSREAGMPDTITKDMLDAAMDGADGLDPTIPAGVPDGLGDMPGDPGDPGSPAWEAVDAATAVKWTTILAGARRAVCWLQDREMLEAATVDPGDAEHACDLGTVLDALDYAISVLAPFAVAEQSESDGAAMEMAVKSAGPSTVLEAAVLIAKAGRVLSSANEARIRNAAQELTDVLASLPMAPADGGTAAVTKEGAMPESTAVAKDTATAEEQARDTGPVNAGGTTGMGEPRESGPAAALPGDGPQAARPGDVPGRTVIKAALPVVVFDHARNLIGITSAESVVQKADGGKEMMAVFDQAGNLVGVVDASKVQPVSGAGKPADSGDDGADDTDGDGGDAAPAAAPAPGAAPADDGADDADSMEPQPPADAGTPADDVAKSGDPRNEMPATGVQDVVKAVTEQIAKALGTSEAAHQQVVAKMAADKAEQAKEIEALKSRLETVENTPAMPKAVFNGVVPPAQLRGQDHGGTQVDVAKAADLKRTLTSGNATTAEQNQAYRDLMGLSIAKLSELRGQ